MKENTSLKDLLTDDFAQREIAANGTASSSFFQQQKDAFRTFEILGFPTPKNEEWKYSNVKHLVNDQYTINGASTLHRSDLDIMGIPELGGNILYIVNGVYQPEISQIISPENQILIKPIKEVQESDPALFATYYNTLAKNEQEAFTALNTAYSEDGLFIHVPKGTVVEEPVVLRFVSDARDKNAGSISRVVLAVEENAQVKLVESFRTKGDLKSFTNVVTEIHVAESAHVEYYKVEIESGNAHHIGTTQVRMLDKSHFYAATVTLDGGFIRNNLNIEIDGQYCEAYMYGLYLPDGRQHIDNHTLADHRQPNSYSNELYKGVLLDQSVGVFNGKVFVRPDAQKTNAYQSCKNVVLSPGAKMNTKPQLEIFADDVKCSHGTTTGQLDDEALFYLRSRGIPRKEALGLLMFAFCEDVLSNIRIAPIREYLEKIVAKKLNAEEQ
jgi:Fe-S cluster assembly protein SufD